MAEGKGIEVRISATGGDQAAAEVRKPTEAMKDQAAVEQDLAERKAKFQEEAAQRRKEMEEAQNSTGFGGMLDGSPERIEETSTALEKMAESETKVAAAAKPMAEHLGEAEQAVVKTGEQADETNAKLDKMINLQRAQVANQLAGALGNIGNHIRETADKFREADPEFSDTLTNLADGMSMASSAAAGAAQGFGVGGPFGAAAGALIGGAIIPLKNAFDDMVESTVRAEQSQQSAAVMAVRLAQAQAAGVDATFTAAEASEALAKFYDQETDAIDRTIAALERKKRIQDAEDKANASARDRADAAAIRGGAEPENVRIRRVNDDEAAAKAKIDADIEQQRSLARDASNAAKRARGDVEGLKVSGGTTPEQIAEAEKKVKDLEDRAAALQAQLDESTALAGPRKREISETAAGRIESLTEQRTQRRQREEEQARQEEERQKEKEQRDRDRESAAALRDEGSAAKIGRDAVKLLPDGLRGELRESITEASRKLQDGDQGGEIKTLISLVKQLASITANQPETAAAIAELKRDIATLEARQKNARTGK